MILAIPSSGHQRNNLETLTHLFLDKMVAIVKTTFSKALYWIKKYIFFIKISLKFVPIDNKPALI